MLTAMRAVENVMTGSKHDLWAVNAESAYHEEHQEPEQPYKRVPSTQYEREPLHATEESRRLTDVCPIGPFPVRCHSDPHAYGGRSDGVASSRRGQRKDSQSTAVSYDTAVSR